MEQQEEQQKEEEEEEKQQPLQIQKEMPEAQQLPEEEKKEADGEEEEQQLREEKKVVEDEEQQIREEEEVNNDSKELQGDKERHLQLPKEEEVEQEQQQDHLPLANGKEVNLQLQEQEQQEDLPLTNEKEDNLQLQEPEQQEDLPLTNEKEEDSNLPKEKEDNLKLQEEKEEADNLQLGEEKEDSLQLSLKQDEDNLQVKDEKNDSLNLQEEKEDSLQVQDDDSQLPKEEKDDSLQLQEEKEEDSLQVQDNDLELSKEKDDNLQLHEEKEEDNLQVPDDSQLPKGKDGNLLLHEGKEKDDLQVPDDSQLLKGEDDSLQLEKEEDNLQLPDDSQVPKGEDDSLQLQEEKEEDNSELRKEDNLALVKEDEEERADVDEDGKEKDIDKNCVDSDITNIDNQRDENIQDLNDDDDDDLRPAGTPSPVDTAAAGDAETGAAGSEDTGEGGDVNMEDAEVETEVNVVDASKGKRKRGKVQGKSKPTPPTQRKKKDEEDVCFICYDGGSLVLCDRRGCPKAYHLACIKRDEAFFQSKAKWNCDWHICSSCQKASHYMCYTCAYSVCKGCSKDADYVCVRGNKGFCGACMRTIMLIENMTRGNTEMAQVDFDDKSSWEYLFKDYWIDLKDKLSLTVDELTKAKNAKNLSKGDEPPKAKNSGKGIGSTVASKDVSPSELYHVDDEKEPSLDNGGNVETNRSRSKRRKTKDRAKILSKQNSLVMEDSDVDEDTPLTEGTTWATKELLEFVAHMRNGDTSAVTQFDVQALLVEYIKRNNLRDPRQKSVIICDSRLRNLFGQPRVGHFEMLKLLENHFLIKDTSPADDSARAGVSDAVGSEAEAGGSSDSRNERRRKIRKKVDRRRSNGNPNSEEYAAIDVHNINLLYLKRSLIENLMDNSEKFHDMVVGSFVRIRISGGDQKQNMYRLVPVVGTSKVAESYKVGSRTTDFMLEILNLNKKETVSIDGISNQEFLEDECRRLRQSIKCGLIKRLKVGEIQEKAMALQPVKVSDWLQAEISRLNHLRDRASEKGHRKELRECVEKLDLLKSPKERQRRLHEIPDVHIDPNMDPSYESDDDAGESDDMKQGDHGRPRNTGFGRKVLERNSSFRERESDLNDVGNRLQRNLSSVSERSRNIGTPLYVDRESKWSQGGGAFGLNNQNASKNQLSPTGLVTSDWNSRAAVRSESYHGVASAAIPPPHSSAVRPEVAILLSLSSGRELPHVDFETEKVWHYQDPSRNIQGPFSITQLRKWSAKGHFPPHFRVWRTNEKQDDSILLTDVLDGRFPRRP